MSAYAERILALLGASDPLEILAATPSRLADLHRKLKGAKLHASYGEGKWTAQQILAHLVDSESIVGVRVRLALTQEHPTVQPYDQDALVALYHGIDAGLAIEVFRTLRTWNLEIYRSLTPTQRTRGMYHPERGEESVGLVIALLAGHDLNHLAELEAIARA